MGKNKQQLERYLVLDQCFKSENEKYFKQDLLWEIQNQTGIVINERTLENDIRDIKKLIPTGSSVKLESFKDENDRRKVYWRYTDTSFTIFSQLVNTEEKHKIEVALSVLSSLAGMPHFEWVQEIMNGLSKKLDIDNNQKEIIAFDTNMRLVGLQYLTPLYEAIIAETVLIIKYNDFSDKPPYSFIYHPHFIKQYNNRWFIFGKGVSDLYQYDPWVLPLDRIVSLKKTTTKYIKSDRDWNEYFFDIVGISRPKNIEETLIKLAVNRKQANYIKTKPLHYTQSEGKWINDDYIIEVTLIPNFEFESILLSFGEHIKVLEPEWFSLKIKNRLFLSLEKYQHKN